MLSHAVPGLPVYEAPWNTVKLAVKCFRSAYVCKACHEGVDGNDEVREVVKSKNYVSSIIDLVSRFPKRTQKNAEKRKRPQKRCRFTGFFSFFWGLLRSLFLPSNSLSVILPSTRYSISALYWKQYQYCPWMFNALSELKFALKNGWWLFSRAYFSRSMRTSQKHAR